MKPDLPTGTVTFLFTDIEGSTRLAQKFSGDLPLLLARHKELLKQAFDAHHGYIFQIVGDSFSVAFHTASDALKAAIDAQRRVQSEAWSPAPVHVRMGIHTGAAELGGEASTEGPYAGYATLAFTQRIMSAAHGGQILLSQITRDLLVEELPGGTTLLDMGEHHLKDVLHPLHIYQVVVTDLRTRFPPLRTQESFPHNLPIPLTSFIGRAREIADARQLLSNAHLLTLVGPGGTGKTRLSLQLAADRLPSFTDGVWFIELAPLVDPLLVPQMIAAVFELRELQNIPTLEIVTDYLRAKEILLILDNCEHLIAACAGLSDHLLRSCPRLKILASSREALGIAGETVYHVPPLSLPDPAHVTPEALLDSEAARLFLERASAVQSNFHLTDQNASAVARICHRLDGIPLALELAAARVAVFSAEEIAAHLEDRFKLLTGGNRAALPRHQTLRALIDWSYDLLSPEEQILFRRLSVFSGGWTLEAAEHICAGGEQDAARIAAEDILDLLSGLVRKSLVMVEQAETTRYRLLETIRHYASETLLHAGESETWQNRHLDFFLQLAEQAGENMNGPQEMDWVNRLEAEYGNLRAAMEWSQKNNLEAALRFGGALAMFWVWRGYSLEGLQWLPDILRRSKELPEESRSSTRMISFHARALLGIGILDFNLGDTTSAAVALEECATLSKQLGDLHLRSWAISYLSINSAFRGEMAGAYAFAEESLVLGRELGEGMPLAMGLNNMAIVTGLVRNDFKAARTYADEAFKILSEAGSRWYSAMALFGFGLFEESQGNHAEARSRFEACMPLFVESKDRHRIVMLRSELAHLERRQGHISEAKKAYRETLQAWQELGHRAAIAHQLECFAMLAKAAEDEGRAARIFGAAQALRERINIPMQLMERMEYDREVNELRDGMDREAFASYWAEGRALSMEDAIRFALEA
ncbi:MAG TPA: adenylate/guanylate cyclase domain-containing protein [Anaerolineales bacterium]